MSNELETRLMKVEVNMKKLEARIEKTIKDLEPVLELLGQTTLRVQALEEKSQKDTEEIEALNHNISKALRKGTTGEKKEV